MITAHINNTACVIYYDKRISPDEAPVGFPHMYQIRHDEDDWTLPISIERFVAVNFFGTVFMKEPIEFDTDGYIEIEQFKLHDDYINFRVSKELFLR